MPYSGLPSKSCEACRKTKTKCDTQRPSCRQCIRLGRQCPGYRDRMELLFRDESEKVKQKGMARKKKRNNTQIMKAPRPPSQQTRSCLSRSKVDDAVWSTMRTSRLNPPLRDMAISVFLFQYGCTTSSCFNYIPELCAVPGITGCKDVFLDTLECLGMAYLSTASRGAICHMRQAGEKYGQVVKAINMGLHDPEFAASDYTLSAILMLALFESITGRDTNSFRWWSKHLHGASAIVVARGSKQFQSELSRKVFVHFLHLLVLYALLQQEAVPEEIEQLSKLIIPTDESEKKQHALFKLVGQICSLRAREVDETSNPKIMAATAVHIDNALEQWAADFCLSPMINSNTTDFERASNTLSPQSTIDCHTVSGRLHSPSLLICYASRLIANDVALRQILCVAFAENWSEQKLVEAIELRQHNQRVVGAEICDSVPLSILSSAQSTPEAGLDIKGVVGHALIWPLYAVATTDGGGISADTRLLAIDRLQDIASRAALSQGTALVGILKKKFEITAWNLVNWDHSSMTDDQQAQSEAGRDCKVSELEQEL